MIFLNCLEFKYDRFESWMNIEYWSNEFKFIFKKLKNFLIKILHSFKVNFSFLLKIIIVIYNFICFVKYQLFFQFFFIKNDLIVNFTILKNINRIHVKNFFEKEEIFFIKNKYFSKIICINLKIFQNNRIFI